MSTMAPHHPCTRWFIVALLVCAGSGCRGKQETVVQLDGPIAVRWIYTLEYQGSHGPCVLSHKRERAFLEISGPTGRIKHAVPCWKPGPQLAAHAGKRLVAYRCGARQPWVLLHLGKTQALTDAVADLGQGDQPTWGKAPTLADSALGALRGGRGKPCRPGKAFKAIEQLRGVEGVVRLLTESASMKLCDWKSYTRGRDLWDRRMLALPAAAQERVRAGLRKQLASGDASHWLVRRTAAMTPLEKAEVQERLARHVRRHLAAQIAEGTSAGKRPRASPALRSAIVAIQRLAPKDRAAAGELACHALKLHARSTSNMIDALAVVAYTGATCPAVGAIVAKRRLGCWASQARCPQKGGAFEGCTPEALAATVARVVEAAARRKGSYYDHDHKAAPAVVLAAARLHGPLPGWLVKAAQRSRYKTIQPKMLKGVESCSSTHIKRGARCYCFTSSNLSEHGLPQTLCALDPGPLSGDLDHTHCRFRVDDDKRTITVVGKR